MGEKAQIDDDLYERFAHALLPLMCVRMGVWLPTKLINNYYQFHTYLHS